MTSKSTIFGTSEAAAKAIGRETDEIFVLDEGEEITINDGRTPEEALLDKMATELIERSERDDIIGSFGLTIESPAERHGDVVTSMVLDLFNRETKEDFEEFCAKYGALAETPNIKAYIKSKLA